MKEPASLRLHELTVRAGGQRLLRNASVEFPPGKITLIVGASGAGKSTLLRILAGLIDETGSPVSVEGEVYLNDRLRKPKQLQGEVGVVFQNFALFDELSPSENASLAEAHRAGELKDKSLAAKSLLTELGVPTGTPTSALSGGQRQRLAIARTLAYDPKVVLYDEPTSGLDSVTAERVAKLIQHTHESHGKTSLIVTHDYESLTSIADEVYLLDTTTQSLVPVRRELWPDLGQMLTPREEAAVGKKSGKRLSDTALLKLGRFFESTTSTAEKVAATPVALLPVWRSPYWGMRYFLHFLWLVAGPSAMIYLATAGAIVGFVTTYFTFIFLPFPHLTHDLLLENVLSAIGFLLYRVLVPIMATVLIAARSGAAVASDVGGKVYGRQADTLKTFGASPQRYWLTGTLWAFLIGTPLLTGICYLVAAGVSVAVFSSTHPEYGPNFWSQYYHTRLAVADQWTFVGFPWLFAKLLTCAIGIGLISYHTGAGPKQSSNDVSRGVTATILWATLYVLLIHFLFAFYEFVPET